jgi:parvulin-like peptidyl-prolyl isomerase
MILSTATGRLCRRPGWHRVAMLAGALLLASGALWAGGCRSGGQGSAATPSADPVVARVNGRSVYKSQVAAALGEARLANRAATEKQALKAVIDEELLRQEAERLGVAPSTALVEARLRALERQVGGAAALDKALKSAGLTRAQLRERLAVVALGERVASAKFPNVSVSRRDAETYYRRHLFVFTYPALVKLGDIVVRSERLAQGAIRKIGSGQSFYATARQFITTDPELRQSGGQLGWVSVDSLPAPIARAVAKLAPGQMSSPVRNVNGINVLKLYGRRAAHTIPFAKVEGQVRSAVLAERRAAALRRWIDQVRARAKIDILP